MRTPVWSPLPASLTSSEAAFVRSRVVVTDQGGLSAASTFSIPVIGDGPVDVQFNSSLSVPENTGPDHVIGTVDAYQNAEEIAATFALLDTAGGLFRLDGDTLKVAPGALIDFEVATSHTVRIETTYGNGSTDSKDFVIQVVNQPISDVALASGGLVRETDIAGTVIATFEAFENPLEPTATFSLIDDAGGLFELEGHELKVAAGASIDYFAQSSHTVTIGASDASGPLHQENFDIEVLGDGPIELQFESTGGLAENASGGQTAGTIRPARNGTDITAALDPHR